MDMNKKALVTIDAMSLSTKARRRMRTSREETIILEDFYSKNPNPNNEQKQEIASTVKMGPKNVHFWFQNRRAKDNKKRKMIKLRQQELAQQQLPNQQSQMYQQHYLQHNSKGKAKFNLPPISAFMAQKSPDLSIPFYFHHSKFGIADCMIQWSKSNDKEY